MGAPAGNLPDRASAVIMMVRLDDHGGFPGLEHRKTTAIT